MTKFLLERIADLTIYFMEESSFCNDRSRDENVMNHDFWLGKSVAYERVAEYIANALTDWKNYVMNNKENSND